MPLIIEIRHISIAVRNAAEGLTLFVAALSLVACQTHAPSTQKESVGVIIKGSDIETPENTATRKLRDLLEAELASHPDFVLATPGTGTLIVYIPELVRIDGSKRPTIVTYKAEMSRKSSGAKELVTGSCAATFLSGCSQMIIFQLAKFARNSG